MSRIGDQITHHELESLLHEIDYEGFLILPLEKLYRLLGKGNRAAGTWQALLDAWEGIDGDINQLRIAELINERLLITIEKTEKVTKWAGHENE